MAGWLDEGGGGRCGAGVGAREAGLHGRLGVNADRPINCVRILVVHWYNAGTTPVLDK